MDKIEQSLTTIFKKHRIVFWYDTKEELRREFEALALPDVENIELKNNEFGVKLRVLKKQPAQTNNNWVSRPRALLDLLVVLSMSFAVRWLLRSIRHR